MKRNMPVYLSIWDRLPAFAQEELRRLSQPVWCGRLRRITQLSSYWRSDRSKLVDCYYIEQFLQLQRQAIHRRVLEGGNRDDTCRHGIDVEQSDMLVSVWSGV